MKKDRRQINKSWEFYNNVGERFLGQQVGTGKNSYIKTRFLGYNKDFDETAKKCSECGARMEKL